MKDCYNREINYLRISVTDRCNLRCNYCMPQDGIECVSMDEILSFEEITAVCKQAVRLGITRLKVTGGEPLVRRGIAKLIKMLHEIDGIEQVTMTTNGILLANHIDELVASGLDAVNISIDSMDEDRYRQVTRGGELVQALSGLDAAIDSGIKVKVNTVLYPGNDWKLLVAIAKDKPVDVRFIETMPIGEGREYSGVFMEDIQQYFDRQGIELKTDYNIHGNGPAIYYKPAGYRGHIGIIAPIHGKFCGSCNRIRLTSTGMVRPCLCFDEMIDIKKCVREGTGVDIYEALKRAILAKPKEHRFLEGDYISGMECMSGIGG